MFGLDAWMAKQHLVSHLIVAGAKWLIMPGNPVMAHVPPSMVPEITTELQSEIASREKIIQDAAAKMNATEK